MITGLGEKEASALARDHVCACGGTIIVCWGGAFGVNDYIVRCLKDIQHQTIRKKETNIRRLVNAKGEWEPFDMTTQQPVNQAHPLAIFTTEAGMLERVDQVKALAPRWAKDMNEGQRRALAVCARAYGLDPLMEDMILYQGKPMITIKGRRRKDAEAGHHPDVSFRFLRADEVEGFTRAGALHDGDLVQVCILKTEWGNTVEATGTVSKRERDAKTQPVVNTHPIEMCQKRAEDRARSMAYGPLPRPTLPPGFEVIEGEGRLMDDGPALASPAQPPAATPSRVPPASGAQAPKAPAAAQRPAQAEQQGAVCTIHGNIRLAKHPTLGMVHKMQTPDGEVWCNGQPPPRDDVDTDTGEMTNPPDDAPEDLPASVAQDLEGLQAAVKAKGMTWEYFEITILRMGWAEWLKRSHTVAEAMRLMSPGAGR